MRVIKSGNAKTNWTHEVECHVCKAQLEVSKSDCEHRIDRRDGNYFVAKCPECLNPITITARLVEV